MLYKRLIINGTEYFLAVAQSGKGAPTAATEGSVGVSYMDEDTGVLYKCTGAAGGVYTWEPMGAGGSGEDGGYYTPGVSKPNETTVQFEFTPSKSGMPAVAPVTVELPTAPGADSSQDPSVSSVDIANIKTVLGNLMTIIGAQVEDENGTPQGYNKDISGLVAQNNTLIAALGSGGDSGGDEEPDTPVTPETTLSSISATYSGGSVPVGTAVTALTGIVVTAHYSDGTSNVVTGYTLSGTITEGENTITVTYQGMTTTFAVTGVAESGGDSGDGVTSINWFIATNDPEQGTIATYGLKEPDNGYLVTTDSTAHAALGTGKPVPAWPLISGKTYSIRISNADTANSQFFGLWVSTLNTEPIKGEITAVTDTIVKDLERWNAAPAGGYKDYAYTAGSGEYLMINANAGNVLTITAEVTA